jgi:hypothetical protein
MLRALAGTCVLAGCVLSLPVASAAQEVVHALTGTVSAINSTAGYITVFQDNGTRGVFDDMTAKHRVSLDKRIAADTTAVNAFDKQGAYAIVFYYTKGDDQIAVALKNLGAGPFASTVGTVKKFDGHRELTVVDKTGAAQTFKVDEKTVAEGMFGAVEGSKFDTHKGDQVRVVSANVGGTPTALFLTTM